MATERLIVRLCREGAFRMLPLPSATGFDDGLLFYRLHPAFIDVVAVWSETYAVSVRLASKRNMREPFQPTPASRRHVGTLKEIVDDLVGVRGRHAGLTAQGSSVEGAEFQTATDVGEAREA